MSRVLLAGIPDRLAGPLTEDLGRRHSVRAIDGSVLNVSDCERASACDVVIHGLDATGPESGLIDQATRGIWNLLTTSHATRFIQLSSMRLYDAYGGGWALDETWAPRPSTTTANLAPYLAEAASREISRSRDIRCIVLRMDDILEPESWEAGAGTGTSLHIDDAIEAIVRAVDVPDQRLGPDRWKAFNIVQGGPSSRWPASRAIREVLGFQPNHRAIINAGDVRAPTWPVEPAPITDIAAPRRIAILGAGGPLGAATAPMLARDTWLRLCDYRALAEIARLPPQSAGAPLPVPPDPPHEEVRCDITDLDNVSALVHGMDAIVNCTVIREDPVEAFRVNTLGAWNVMRAAVGAGIRRVVHTGPVLTLAPHPAGDVDDIRVGDDVPARPGDNLYLVSKFLGQEICRIFAEQHRIACPALYFIGFVNPESAARLGDIPSSFSISWDDAGRAMAAATRVDALSEPFTILHILADAPHGRYTNAKARSVLSWTPNDRLDHLWLQTGSGPQD